MFRIIDEIEQINIKISFKIFLFLLSLAQFNITRKEIKKRVSKRIANDNFGSIDSFVPAPNKGSKAIIISAKKLLMNIEIAL